MAEERLSTKIVFTIIDKLVIGVVAAGIVLLFNAEYDKGQRNREESIAVAKVHSEILMQLRTKFTNTMEDYFSLGISLITGEVNDSRIMTINNLTEKLENVLFNMIIIDSSLVERSNTILSSIKNVNEYISKIWKTTGDEKENARTQLATEMGVLRRIYGRTLLSIRETCINAIKHDIAATGR